jgi:dTDP-glucose 4,6-dehydratase
MAKHDTVVHFAAETHVDRSIQSPPTFLETNIIGTGVLIDSARRQGVERFIHISTDEVYGSIPEGSASEEAPLAPSSPYSASKAASDLIAGSYAVTFDYPVIITRSTNNYGPYQFPEKMIPKFVTHLLDEEEAPLYGEGQHERDWLFVEDHCAALTLLVEQGRPGEIYNIGADAPLPNIETARRILRALGRDESWIVSIPDRPGHDLRYSVDTSKLRGLGWQPARSFDDRLAETIDWYKSRQDWWRPLKSQLA